jgi:phosphoenolpyruvate synthase/pyruvate phosphate dikinase
MDILWLGHPECHNIELVGPKAGNLSRLSGAHRVPPGFCITTEPYVRWSSLFNGAQTPANLESVPSPFLDVLTAAYQELSAQCGASNPSVAVRSSAVDEDGGTTSFAGQHSTFLNVVGVDNLVRAVIDCWRSAQAERALEYRQQQGMATDGLRLAVLVQKLVKADSSSVVFSANPVTGSRDELMINASWGLGESVVGGSVNPDTYLIRKADLAITSRQISDKQRMTVLTAEGTQEVPVPRKQRTVAAISDAQALEMARLALALESSMGWPVDLECSFENRTLFLLQCRPITTLTSHPSQ